VPDTRLLPIADLPLPQFKVLLESHKSRLADTHGAGLDSALDSVFNDWRDLKHRAREQEPPRAQLQAEKIASDYVQAPELVAKGYLNLARACGGIARVMSPSATVESDFSVVKFVKDLPKNSLSNISLQCLMVMRDLVVVARLAGSHIALEFCRSESSDV
jgi:hypothetical protein